MNRRGFISGLAAVVGGVALEQAIPFGRVWSFPSAIRPANLRDVIAIRYAKQYTIRSIYPPHLLVNQIEGDFLTALRVTNADAFDIGQSIQIAADWER